MNVVLLSHYLSFRNLKIHLVTYVMTVIQRIGKTTVNYAIRRAGSKFKLGGANMASASEPKKFFWFAPPRPPKVMILEGPTGAYITKYFLQFVISKNTQTYSGQNSMRYAEL